MKKKLLLVFGLMTGITIIAAGCGKEQPGTGVTDTEIRIAQWGPQSGPASLWGGVARGTACYFKMINDEGGIAGRKIKYSLRDDGYQPHRTKTEVKKLVESEGIFAFVGGLGTATGMAVKQYLHDHKIPWIGPASGSTHWINPPTKYLFSTYALYSTEVVALVDYAVKKLNRKKIAVFYQNDDYGRAGLYGAEVALEKMNMNLIEKVSAEITDSDLSSHALKLKNSGADTVILWLLPKHASSILRTAAKIDYHPQWLTSSSLSDMFIMHKITRGLWKDVIFVNFAERPDSDSALMTKYRRAHKKYAPNDRWGVAFMCGFMLAEPLVEALRMCGRDLTVERFVKAMESLKNFRGIGPKITFGPGIRQGTTSVFIAKCINGKKAKNLTGWVTPKYDLNEVIRRINK